MIRQPNPTRFMCAGNKKLVLAASLGLVIGCQNPAVSPDQPITPQANMPLPAPCAAAIQVVSPQPNDTVGSPLTVSGQARGTWYFEASFPVRLFDVAMNELAVAPAQAQGDWMTEEFVPFEVTLPAFTTDGQLGYLFLEKDNPSDEIDLSCSIVIPVRF